MDTVEILKQALELNAATIAGSNLLAAWISAFLGAISILVTILAIFLGYRYLQNEALITRRVKEEVSATAVGLRGIFEEKMNSNKKEIDGQISTVRNEIATIWSRSVAVSKEKDLFAFAKAFGFQIEANDAEKVISILSELVQVARNTPSIVADNYWETLGFNRYIEMSKQIEGITEEQKAIITGYQFHLKELKDLYNRVKSNAPFKSAKFSASAKAEVNPTPSTPDKPA